MARYDKYDPCSGGFRAPLAAAFTGGTNGADFGKVIAVGLNSSGQITPGDGTNAPASGYLGVMILLEAKSAGQPVDVMNAGEIVEFDKVTNGVTTPTAGTKYYADATTAKNGTLTATATTNAQIGFTVEASRLIVRMKY